MNAAEELLALEELLDIEEQRFKKQCEDSLAFFFTNVVWPILNAKVQLQWNWPLALLCANAEQVMQGTPARWVVNLAVRTGKSLLLSVALPIWWWLKHPSFSFAFYSHSDDLRTDLQRKRLKVLRSPLFRQLWPDIAIPYRVSIDIVTNDAGGELRLLGPGATGLGGDGIIIDDPSSIMQAKSEKRLQNQEETVREAIFSRLNQRTGPIIVVQQRASEEDLSAKLRAIEGWVFTALPAAFEEESFADVFNGSRLKIPKGAMLDPTRYSESALSEMKQAMGSRAFDAQIMQRPHAGEMIVNPAWLKPLDLSQGDWRSLMDLVVIAIDTASVATEGHSRWGILVFGIKTRKYIRYVNGIKRADYKNVYVLLNCATKHREYAEAKKVIQHLHQKYSVDQIWIEAATHGVILAQELLRAGIGGVRAISIGGNDGSKANRLWSATPPIEDGRLYIPINQPWASEFKKDIIRCKKKLPRSDPAWDNADTLSLFVNEAEASKGLLMMNLLQGWSSLSTITKQSEEELDEPEPIGIDSMCPPGYTHLWDLKRSAQVITNVHSEQMVFGMKDPEGHLWDVSQDEIDKLLESGWVLETA